MDKVVRMKNIGSTYENWMYFINLFLKIKSIKTVLQLYARALSFCKDDT